MTRLKRIRGGKKKIMKLWDDLPWRSVNTENENLGDYDDSVFFGLEEIDGNSYVLEKTSSGITPKPVITSSSAASSSSSKVTQSERRKNADSYSDDSNDSQSSPRRKENKISNHHDVGGKNKLALTDTPANIDNVSSWGSIQLCSILTDSLIKLNFLTPTLIQERAIPITLGRESNKNKNKNKNKHENNGNYKPLCDLIGCAETGSGKTLAFSLPIIDSILKNWSTCFRLKRPYALIIAPTRELAMQITSVFKDVCNTINDQNKNKSIRIEIVTLVGGLSEHKQRRLLSLESKKPIHVVVATPGRIVELFEDETIYAFQDLSSLRYLVIDEADRMMEDGHFSELHRVFSRIKSHEEIRKEGKDPAVLVSQRSHDDINDDGNDDVIYFDEKDIDDFMPKPLTSDNIYNSEVKRDKRFNAKEDSSQDDNDDNDDVENNADNYDDDETNSIYENNMNLYGFDDGLKFDPVPTEEQLKQAWNEDLNKGKNRNSINGSNDGDDGADSGNERISQYQPTRQTLLYSATALQTLKQKETNHSSKQDKLNKKAKLNGVLIGIPDGSSLPNQLKQLLSLTGIQKSIYVIDSATKFLQTQNSNSNDNNGNNLIDSDNSSIMIKIKSESDDIAGKKDIINQLTILPKGLSQLEILVPSEEKDLYVYYFLLKYSGRTLLFVNSIKTARKIDGLLRALGINSRTIHAQMQQKQRFKALESFRASPIGVMVATDVAARGLDIPKVKYVLHYDISRSAQVYIHRSGRTARGNEEGTAISFVAPEDNEYHKVICDYLKGSLPPASLDGILSMPKLKIQLEWLPQLRNRIKLAKQIFTKSFISSQHQKESQWLNQTANETGLLIDDEMRKELMEYNDDDDNDNDNDQNSSHKEVTNQNQHEIKRQIEKYKADLRVLLDQPLDMQGNKYSDNQNKIKAPRAGRKTMKGKKFVNKPSTKSIGGGFVVYRPPDL